MPNYSLQAFDENNLEVKSLVVCELWTEPTVEVAERCLEVEHGKYTIVIKRLSDCYGCANELGGQRDHMDCPSGCLHDKESCFC